MPVGNAKRNEDSSNAVINGSGFQCSKPQARPGERQSACGILHKFETEHSTYFFKVFEAEALPFATHKS